MGSHTVSNPPTSKEFGTWGYAFDRDHPPCNCTAHAVGPSFALLIVFLLSLAIKIDTSIRAKTILAFDNILGYIAGGFCFAFLLIIINNAQWGMANDKKYDWFSHGDKIPTQFPRDFATRIYLVQAFYNFDVSSNKLALLALYFQRCTNHRLPLRSRLRGLMGAVFIFEVLVYIASLVINWYWFAYGYVRGSQDEQDSAIKLTGMINALLDICLMVVPIIAIGRLRIGRKEMITIATILALGSSVTILSSMRSILLSAKLSHISSHWSPAHWTMYQYNMMGAEVVLGYICFCLPAFNDFFVKSGRLTSWYEGLMSFATKTARPSRIDRRSHKRYESELSRGVLEEDSQIELLEPERAYIAEERC